MSNKKQVEDFLADEEFIRWVRGTDKGLDEYWKKWLEYNPEEKDTLLLAREIILSMGIQFWEHETEKIEATKDDILKNILSETHSSGLPVKEIRPTKRHFRIPIFLKVAAILILCFTVGLIYERTRKETEEVAINLEVIKDNLRGRMQTILPDGTEVWLHSSTRISYASNMTDLPTREVTLEGEAYFKVAKDKDHPFIVKSRDFSTTALGTAFNVDAYPGDDKIVVSLAEGKVRVSEENKISGNSYLLTPNHQLSYAIPSDEIQIKPFDLETEIGWIHGLLTFKDAGFHEVTRKLEKFYTIRIDWEGEPPVWKYTGRFENTPLPVVLERLSTVEQFHYSLKEQTLTLWK